MTSISVSRLYNTGNYTNVKYDIAAEVPKGASAAVALREIVNILALLRPIPVPSIASSYEAALKQPKKQWNEYTKENFEYWKGLMEQFKQARQERMAAVERLDALGGSSTRKDAKEDWDEDVPY